MGRSSRGFSLVDTIVAVAVLAVLSVGMTQLLLMYTQQKVTAGELRTKLSIAKEMDSDFSVFLHDAVLASGTANDSFIDSGTTSQAWNWSNSQATIAQLQPQVVPLQNDSGVGIQDRNAAVVFDGDAETLTVTYQYIPNGQLVTGVDGASVQFATAGPIRIDKVSEAELVKTGSSLRLWVKRDGEWYDFEGGVVLQ